MSEEEIVEALNEIAARFREQRLYGSAWGPYSARCILDALDGDSDE